jgi:hypothetical protein
LLGEPEVEDHGIAILRDDQVPRLDVAVDDARLVRGVQRASRVLEQLQTAHDPGPCPRPGT